MPPARPSTGAPHGAALFATALVAGVALRLSVDQPALFATVALLGVIALVAWWRRPIAVGESQPASETPPSPPSTSSTAPEPLPLPPPLPPTPAVNADLSAVWDQSPLSLLLLDPHAADGVVRILDCNQAACDMHGYTREELIGQSIDLIEAHPWTQWRDSWFAGLRANRRTEGQGEHRRKDGTTFFTEYFTCIVCLEGREMVVGMDRDATAQRAAERALLEAKEQAEAADRAKSEFLAVMSHEIRTPMNGIIGFTNLLQDTPLDAEQRDWLATIRSSGETLLTLINDILDFSKIESGKMEMDLQPARVGRCVEEVLDLLWSKASEKQIELVAWIDPQLPPWVITDIARFRQIVVNLVGNAIKFTPSGEVEVRVEPLDCDSAETGRLIVTVRDTGIGIPQDRINRLFKPFSQADSSTTRQFGGSGLGLAISRRLAVLLDGSVDLVESSPAGSTFRATLPLVPCDPPEGARPTPPTDEVTVDLRGKRALVVDDNETNCRVLTSLLRRWQLEVHTFTRAETALAWMGAGGEADIALLDMMMPDVDGLTLARALRQTHPADRLPLLLLSSVGQDELRRLGDISIFNDILHKPLRQSGLLDALLSALGATNGARHTSASPFTAYSVDVAREFPLSILVAEDNNVNRKLVQQVLERFGYKPRLVTNGRDCLEAMRETRYDLVLMDCQMPQLDGYDATRLLRSGEAGEHHRQVRVVALTAAAMVGDRERCLAAGMDDYLPKPIKADALLDVLKTTPVLPRG